VSNCPVLRAWRIWAKEMDKRVKIACDSIDKMARIFLK